jgi:hypothetical protein
MIRNIFLTSNRFFKRSSNKFELGILLKNFCEKKQNNEIQISSQGSDEENLIVKIPKPIANFYDFGLTNDLPLYQNFGSLRFNTGNHIPLNKLNIMLFGGLTAYAYYSSTFQIAMLIQLYIFNKFLLRQNRKLTEITYISLLPELDTIYIKSHALNLKFDIGSLVLERKVKVGAFSYYILNDKTSKMSFYLNAKGKFLNQDLLSKLINGKSTSVKFEYI